MKREELLRSQEYWLTKIQNGIFNLIEQYRKDKNLNKTQLAAELGVTKGYISQVLNGDFDHKVSKLVDQSLAFNKVPVISYIDMEEYLRNDAADRGNYTLRNSERPIEINTYICEMDEFSATYGYKKGFSIPVKN